MSNTEYAIRFDPWPAMKPQPRNGRPQTHVQFIEGLRMDGRHLECYESDGSVDFCASEFPWRNELKRVSSEYPNYIITLHGRSDVGEEWVAYAKGGRMAVHHRPNWVPPAFIEDELW